MGLKSWWLKDTNSSSIDADSSSSPISTYLDTGEANGGDEEPTVKIQVWGCRRSALKSALCWLLTVLSFGVVRLLFYWKPQWEAIATCRPCSLEKAEIMLIRNQDHEWFLRRVITREITDNNNERKSEHLPPNDMDLPPNGPPKDPPASSAVLLSPNGEALHVNAYRYFTYRKVVYVWHPGFDGFHSLPMFDHRVSCQLYHQCSKGLSGEEAACRRLVYGTNEIAVRMKPIVQLLFVETLNPFYVFQIFSVCVWFADEYYYYASVIVVMSLISIVTDVYQTRKNQRALRDTIYSTDFVTVVRDEKPETLPSTVLVPGDIILVPQHGGVMQCDAVLLAGNVIVNESMLTGESVPVTKTPVPSFGSDVEHTPLVYDNKQHAKHTLYCGTKVLQTRYYSGQSVKAVVIRTGFGTMKGQLVRSIMYPKPVDFEFTKDLLRFVGVLAGVAAVGFVYTILLMASRANSVTKIIIRALDIITIVVPPALPAAMTIGIVAAEQRLKKAKIYCISPSTINTCGGINAVCFDKTGTLTEEGLDFLGVLRADQSTKFLEREILTSKDLGLEDELLRSMACCHSLTRIENELTGDPLDLILFRETGWTLEEPDVVEESGRFDMLAPTVVKPPDSTYEIGILRQFTFSSNLQRMSVVTRVLGSPDFMLYCKGAPETIAKLCRRDTVPEDFGVVLQFYAKKGYRVIAVALRRLTQTSFVRVQRLPREQLESELDFLGLVLLENRLKPASTPVIEQLRRAAMRTIMVTGDNILTAVSVARDCGILDEQRPLYFVEAETRGEIATIRAKSEETVTSAVGRFDLISDTVAFVDDFCWDAEFGGMANGGGSNGASKVASMPNLFAKADYQMAIAGPSFAVVVKHFPHLVPPLVAVCNVFARMAPEQKAQLVTSLQEIGYVVAMCGDGANDCGALKAAHAGISLSEAEASIASPFTSKTPNISCVPTVIREGRAALTTSFGVFKYMAGYSLTQFLSVSILYSIATNLSDFQFLFIDLFLITVFAVLFGYTPASEVLVARPPATRILSVHSIASIVVQLIIVAAFQIFAFEFIALQPWFVPFVDPHDEDNFNTYQGTCVFLQSLFQYIALVIVYSKSHPYRKTLFNNRLLSGALVVGTLVSLAVTIYPPSAIAYWLQLKMPPYITYRFVMVFAAILNFLISSVAEKTLIDWLLETVARRKGWIERCCGTNNRGGPKNVRYAEILDEIGRAPNWCNRKRKRLVSGTNQSRIVAELEPEKLSTRGRTLSNGLGGSRRVSRTSSGGGRKSRRSRTVTVDSSDDEFLFDTVLEEVVVLEDDGDKAMIGGGGRVERGGGSVGEEVFVSGTPRQTTRL